MERTLNVLALILLFSCASAPSPEKLAYKDIRHRECLSPLENLSGPRNTFMNLFQQTAGAAGSVVATGAGVVSDTIVVSTGILGTVYLCSRDNFWCEDILGGYVGIMEETDLLWSTKKAYAGTASWRCPYVDHISRAYRKVSECLHEKKEYVAAFEQMSLLEHDHTINECISETEREKWQALKTELTVPEI